LQKLINLFTPALRGGGNNAAFVDRMEIGNIPSRFFFVLKKRRCLRTEPKGKSDKTKNGLALCFLVWVKTNTALW
jgi:hypothetical protein